MRGFNGREPRQSPREGRQKSVSPQGQWFSKVETAHMRGFEGFYRLHHSGVERMAVVLLSIRDQHIISF
jgi:hypothetical protein